MSHAKWALVQMYKRSLTSVEREMIRDLNEERDSAESHDLEYLERARVAVSEALVQIAQFEESRTGSRWRNP